LKLSCACALLLRRSACGSRPWRTSSLILLAAMRASASASCGKVPRKIRGLLVPKAIAETQRDLTGAIGAGAQPGSGVDDLAVLECEAAQAGVGQLLDRHVGGSVVGPNAETVSEFLNQSETP
jgi:hypothetical protein